MRLLIGVLSCVLALLLVSPALAGATTRSLQQLAINSVLPGSPDSFTPDAFNMSLANATLQNKNLKVGDLGQALVGG